MIELVDLPTLRDLCRVYSRELGGDFGLAARPDFIAAVAAMHGGLVFDTLPGLFIGIGVALLLLLYRSSRSHVAELGRVQSGGVTVFGDRERDSDAEPVPGVRILRVEAGLFFANAPAVRTRIDAAAAAPGTHAMILDTEAVPTIDVSAARMLAAVAADLEREGVRLLLAHVVGQVRDVLATEGEGTLDGKIFADISEALRHSGEEDGEPVRLAEPQI